MFVRPLIRVSSSMTLQFFGIGIEARSAPVNAPVDPARSTGGMCLRCCGGTGPDSLDS
ncbi:hypothetical protein BD310DRAFT_919856 [Dichomitus squalens]|uniref:Uncharacterized protein n=1 Tax=Dichomitus squalens TaxID=114155 RepID=A0A4Q9Q580_9APHY|nr:hypothetical protein BD310DRAFT_919856 [Dichomitus squalens]